LSCDIPVVWCGYDVISHAYWAASHRRHRGNLTERISGLKPPRTSLFALTTHSIAPYHAHFSHRTPKPDTTRDLDLNLYTRLSRYCQWLRYQRDLVAFNTLYSLLRGTMRPDDGPVKGPKHVVLPINTTPHY